jgi:hypothetical protein
MQEQEHSTMSNKLLLAVILIALLIGAALGVMLKSAAAPKTILIPGETKTETVIRKVPVTITEIKYAEMNKSKADAGSEPSLFSFADSLKGTKDSVEYNVFHTINKNNDSVASRWSVSLTALSKEYVKEKLTVQLKEVEISKPFFTDGWFWSTLIALPLLLLAIIF